MEGDLIAGGIICQKGRQACFLTAVDLMNILMLTPRFHGKRATNVSIWNEVGNCTEYNILVQIFHQKKDQIRDEVRHIRLKENPNAAQQGDHQRLDRPILKILSRIDQSINGLPKNQVEQDAARREITS